MLIAFLSNFALGIHAVIEQVVKVSNGLLPNALILPEKSLRNVFLVDDMVKFPLVSHFDLDPHHIEVLNV